jgi:hypothetical protein
MINCKPSVRFTVLRREMWKVFPIIEEIWQRKATVATITCGTEAHGQDDPHTQGFAIDVRSKNLPSDEIRHEVLYELRSSLGEDYTVLLEYEGQDNEHYHIQIKKGLWRTLLSVS